MKTAGYVEPVQRKNGWVYFVRPSAAMLKVFPDIKRTTKDSRLEAEQVVRQWHRKWEIHTGVGTDTLVHAPANTVHTLIAAWKRSMAFKDNSENTKRNYRQIIDRLLGWNLGDGKPFSDVLVEDVDYQYAQKIFQVVEDRVTTNNARVTIIRLRAAWAEGRRLNLATTNPFGDLKIPKGHVRRVMWTPDQVKDMVDFCDANGKISIGTIITICYEWMQRPVDVRLLKWNDFDKVNNVAEFAQKKTGAEMRIPVTVGIEKRLKLHSKHNSDDFILREEGTLKPYTADRLTKVFSDMRKDSGLLPKVRDKGKKKPDGSYVYTDVRLADLRRSGVTHGSECGCTHDELMAISGHKNINSLMVYSVLTETNAHNALTKRGLDIVGFKKLGREMRRYKRGTDTQEKLQDIITEQNILIQQLLKEKAANAL